MVSGFYRIAFEEGTDQALYGMGVGSQLDERINMLLRRRSGRRRAVAHGIGSSLLIAERKSVGEYQARIICRISSEGLGVVVWRCSWLQGGRRVPEMTDVAPPMASFPQRLQVEANMSHFDLFSSSNAHVSIRNELQARDQRGAEIRCVKAV